MRTKQWRLLLRKTRSTKRRTATRMTRVRVRRLVAHRPFQLPVAHAHVLAENEEVRHRVKKSKGDYGSDDEANAKKDAKKAKRAPVRLHAPQRDVRFV
jgi:hypothetical protein